MQELVALYKQKLAANATSRMVTGGEGPGPAPVGPSPDSGDAIISLEAAVLQKAGIPSAEDPQLGVLPGAGAAQQAFTEPRPSRALLSAATALGFRFASDSDVLIASETAVSTSQVRAGTQYPHLTASDSLVTDAKDDGANDGVSTSQNPVTLKVLSEKKERATSPLASGNFEIRTSNDTTPFDMSRLWGSVGDAGTHKGSPLCRVFRKDGILDHKCGVQKLVEPAACLMCSAIRH